MHKRMTISIDDAVYDGLIRIVGRGNISRFLEDLIKPYLIKEDLLSAYQEMAADAEGEREALEWSNALIGDVDHAPW